jgi:hypothetical protein
VEDYALALPSRPNGFVGSLEEKLEEHFPPLFAKPFPLVSKPASLVDSEGVILAWFLPEGLTSSRQVITFIFLSPPSLMIIYSKSCGMLLYICNLCSTAVPPPDLGDNPVNFSNHNRIALHLKLAL